jgi:hypothetical protein
MKVWIEWAFLLLYVLQRPELESPNRQEHEVLLFVGFWFGVCDNYVEFLSNCFIFFLKKGLLIIRENTPVAWKLGGFQQRTQA